MLKQAEGYRVRVARSQMKTSAQRAVTNTAQALESRLPQVIPCIADAELVDAPAEETPQVSTLASRRFDIQFRDKKWADQCRTY